MPKRYVIQGFDNADGGKSWYVYDTVERYHIHTASHGFLKEDNSVPICCEKICNALNIVDELKRLDQWNKKNERKVYD